MTRAASLDQNGLECMLRKQESVISRAQTVACGMTPEALRHRIRPGGPWQRLLRGVYLSVTGTPTVAQREIAAALYAGQDSVITGLTALRRHGLREPQTMSLRALSLDCEPIAVLVPARRPRQSSAFVKILPTTRMPAHVCFDGPVQFAMVPRAVADAARELTSFRDVRALVARAVQENLCRLDLLVDELAGSPVRHSAWLRRSLAQVADGIRSGAEGDFHDLLRRAGLPEPIFNARLFAGDVLIAVADAWWPEARVAGEVDSREWHLSPDDWERTLRRHARMGAHGIVVLHFTPGQIRDEPARVVADITAALKAGRDRPALPIRAVRADG